MLVICIHTWHWFHEVYTNYIQHPGSLCPRNSANCTAPYPSLGIKSAHPGPPYPPKFPPLAYPTPGKLPHNPIRGSRSGAGAGFFPGLSGGVTTHQSFPGFGLRQLPLSQLSGYGPLSVGSTVTLVHYFCYLFFQLLRCITLQRIYLYPNSPAHSQSRASRSIAR